jgi:hypothetical protein
MKSEWARDHPGLVFRERIRVWGLQITKRDGWHALGSRGVIAVNKSRTLYAAIIRTTDMRFDSLSGARRSVVEPSLANEQRSNRGRCKPWLDFQDAFVGEYQGAFSDIVFAITDWSTDRRTLGAFRDLFSPSTQPKRK